MQLHHITALYSLNAIVFFFETIISNRKNNTPFLNAFNMVLTLNLCILKVTDATALEFMLPIYY